MTGNSPAALQPPGSKSVQRIYFDNPTYNKTFSNFNYNLTYVDYTTGVEYGIGCPGTYNHIGGAQTTVTPLNVSAGPQTFLETLYLAIPVLNPMSSPSRGLAVVSSSDTARARNGQLYTIYFFDEGPKRQFKVAACTNVSTARWSVRSEMVAPGAYYGLTAAQAGVKNGVVQRGAWQTWYVPNCPGQSSLGLYSNKLLWNAPGEGTSPQTNTSIKSFMESTCSKYAVNVTRTVIGQYGVVEYEVRYVFTQGVYPQGAGNAPLLVVAQGAATDGHTYAPIVQELVQGSSGLAGSFTVDLNDPNGPRTVEMLAPPARLKRVLESFTTVGTVYVERFQYPSSTSGGWNGYKVLTDGTLGGYEWRVYFVANPGTYNGQSFPPGSGQIDPITVKYAAGTSAGGTQVQVQALTYKEGSTPIDGSFVLSFGNASSGLPTTDLVRYDQAPLEFEYLLESATLVGQVSVAGAVRTMQAVPGVYLTVAKDATSVLVEYDAPKTASAAGVLEPGKDIRQMLAPGDVFRIGGAGPEGSTSAAAGAGAQSGIDGATLFGTGLAEASPGSPLILPAASSSVSPPTVYPGEQLRIGADTYTVQKTGVEVQVVSVDCGAYSTATQIGGTTGYCGGFSLAFTHSGVTATTGCLGRLTVGGAMSSAQDFVAAFDAMANVNAGDVLVTRTSNAYSTSYAYSIYFQGPSVRGQVGQLALSSSCSMYSPTTATVITAVQGGYTEVQTVHVNVESGYIAGGSGLFKLNYTSNTLVTAASTPFMNTTSTCIAFGASAADVASALNSIDALSAQLMPFTATVYSAMTNQLTLSSSIFGILRVGQTVSFSDRTYPNSRHFTVTKIVSSTSILVNANVSLAQLSLPSYTGTTLNVFLVQPNSVVVARHGTGNSTSTALTLSSTADSYVDPSNNGYFRLKLTLGTREAVSSTCLRYNAAAADLQSAINAMGFDFNGDGAGGTLADYNHVNVTRSGDGSLASGYGYVYTLRFTGPANTFGTSVVLGDAQPLLEVIDAGHYGGCHDFNSTGAPAVAVAYASTAGGSTVWATTSSTQGVVQVGDMIRLPASAAPTQIYRVLATTKYSIQVDSPLAAFNVPQLPGFNLTVNVVQAPLPDFSVATTQAGEDSYTYDVYFTGPHLASVNALAPIGCPPCVQQSCTHHNGGMLYGVTASGKQKGGSTLVQQISLTSEYPVVNNVARPGFWKIVYEGTLVYPFARQQDSNNGDYKTPTTPTYAKGYLWGAAASVVQADLDMGVWPRNPKNLGVTVSLEGFGGPGEVPRYMYTVSFASAAYDGAIPALSVLTDGGISAPYYTSTNTTLKPRYTLNDLAVSGSYNGTVDATFAVKIVNVHKPPVNCSKSFPPAQCVVLNQFSWCQALAGVSCTTFGAAVNITAGRPVQLNSSNVFVTFAKSSGHYLGDTWTFTAVRCGSKLPKGATVTSTIARSGTPLVDQLTVVPGYTGASYGLAPVYKAPPQFAVQNQQVDTFTLVAQSPITLGLGNKNYYQLQVNSLFSGLSNSSTACLAWNASALQVETALAAVGAGVCLAGADGCVTVTRTPGSAALGNAGGWTYSIYFENTRWQNNFNPDLIQLIADPAASTNGPVYQACGGYSSAGLFTFAMASMNSLHTAFTSTQLPLADPVTGQASAYRGAALKRAPLYKVNGNMWAVRFDSYLGPAPLLVAAPSKYLSAGTSLATYEVVQGRAPMAWTLPNLLTGVDYSVRMQSYTRGPGHGYSNYSAGALVPVQNGSAAALMTTAAFVSLSDGVPSQPPPALAPFVAADALAISEVQTVAVYGSRVQEVQTITTSAQPYAAVQEVVLYTPTGYPLAGNFTLRFPAIQTIEVRAATYGDLYGAFQITYSQYGAGGVLSTSTTPCLDVFASAADVKAALQKLVGVDAVEVVKSGYGGYTDYYGYSWTVSFVGNKVAGNVRLLKVTSFGSEGNGFCANMLPASLAYIVEQANGYPAVGLDTEVQVVSVAAAAFVAQGSYALTYNGVSTGCIAWDAAASDVRAAVLASLTNIDDVYVERTGDGTSASAYGYTYSVYFTGNYVHARSSASPGPLPLLQPATNATGCTAFAQISNGVLVNFAAGASGVTSSRFRARGYHLSTAGTTVATLQSELKHLPSFVAVDYVQRSLSDDGHGWVFTLNLALSMGRAPAVVCGTDATFAAIPGSACSHYTVIEGNAVGGHFVVGNSRLLPFDVSAADMQVHKRTRSRDSRADTIRSPHHTSPLTFLLARCRASCRCRAAWATCRSPAAARTCKGATRGPSPT